VLIRSVDEITNTDRDVTGPGWRSRRIIVAGDGLGYSFHQVELDAGARLEFEYRRTGRPSTAWMV
jgi:L-ectoine synthase